MKKVLRIFSILFLALTIVSCGKITISLDSDNGDPQSTIIVEKKALQVSLPNPEKEGFVFMYWADEYGTQYKDVISVPANDITLKAEYYQKLSITLVSLFDLQDTVIQTEKNANISLPTLEQEGYLFEGWTDGNDIYTGTYKCAESDVILNAVFVPLVTITLDYGDGITEQIQVERFESVQLPSPIKEDYAFYHWEDDFGLSYKDTFENAGFDETLHAIYNKLIQLTFDPDNGQDTFSSTFEITESADYLFNFMDLPDNPEKKGYLFDSWIGEDGKRYDGFVRIPHESMMLKASYIPNWKVYYFVDSFGDKTDYGYIRQSEKANGTFSNSATTNSDLTWYFIVSDKDEGIALVLFEYGSYRVNGSSSYPDEYRISIKDSEGTVFVITAKNSSDRLHVSDIYYDLLLHLMLSEGEYKIVVNETGSYATSSYNLGTVDFAGFKEAYFQLIN